jgi:hypothetical protein
MRHGFRRLDRKRHGAGDLEMDAVNQAMPGKYLLLIGES